MADTDETINRNLILRGITMSLGSKKRDYKTEHNIIAIRLKVHELLMDLHIIDGKDKKEASTLAMDTVRSKSISQLKTIAKNA